MHLLDFWVVPNRDHISPLPVYHRHPVWFRIDCTFLLERYSMDWPFLNLGLFKVSTVFSTKAVSCFTFSAAALQGSAVAITVSALWNSLPLNIGSARTTEAYKSRLKNFILWRLDLHNSLYVQECVFYMLFWFLKMAVTVRWVNLALHLKRHLKAWTSLSVMRIMSFKTKQLKQKIQLHYCCHYSLWIKRKCSHNAAEALFLHFFELQPLPLLCRPFKL